MMKKLHYRYWLFVMMVEAIRYKDEEAMEYLTEEMIELRSLDVRR